MDKNQGKRRDTGQEDKSLSSLRNNMSVYTVPLPSHVPLNLYSVRTNALCGQQLSKVPE